MSHCVSWRDKLRPALAKWRGVMMLTLTVDPKQFHSPLQAWKFVGDNRLISELMRSMHRLKMVRSRQFTVTLEFQKNGWPHWHLLVDSGFVGKHKLEKLWGVGLVWFSKSDFQSIDHAINYATKYITKTAEGENEEFWFPDWVLDYQGNIRRFSTSRGLCKSSRKPAKKKLPGETVRDRTTRTARERAEACGNEVNVLQPIEKTFSVTMEDGTLAVFSELSHRFLGKLDVKFEQWMVDAKQFEIEHLIRISGAKMREPYHGRNGPIDGKSS